jgi:hypothetical protein
MNDFVRAAGEGRVREAVGCPVHGPDRNKIIGRVSDRHNIHTALISKEDDMVIPVILMTEIPPYECTCKK